MLRHRSDNKKFHPKKKTSVPAPKIDVGTNINVEPAVKVDMSSDITSLINAEFEICEKLYNKNTDLNTLYRDCLN